MPIIQVTKPAATTYSNTSNADVYPPNLFAFLITTIIGVGLVLWLWFRKGKEQAKSYEALVVEYSSPNNLRPAEVGTLFDERADTLDVSATIIDLAARGFLTITEEEKKWLFGSTDYVLKKIKKDTANLLPYEKKLLERIFDGEDSVKVSELKTEFYDDLAKVKESLYQDMVDKKFFSVNPEKVRQRHAIFGISILLIGIAIFIVGLFEPLGILSGSGFGITITGAVLLIFSRSFPRRTALGHELFRKILGFRLFIEKVETYKQQYLEKENIFSEVLPYAMVFGVTEKFAKALADLGIKPTQPTWYYSNRPFNPILFSSNINNFSDSLTSAISSQPTRNSFVSSSSGFSSSGGSSGGGFGGGGGGSW